jgi:photosystem II stability/assembly factor-like uncharacterized protein
MDMGKKYYAANISWLLTRAALSFVVAIFMVHCFALSVSASQPNDLFSAFFPADNDGWVCGRWGSVLHTNDGGKTWVKQESGSDYTLSDIYFTDRMNGWAVGDGGTIIHTSDGGKKWIKQESPVPYWLMGVQFVSPMKGWIVTERTTILYTEDGGRKWEIQFKDKDYMFKRVSFCDENNGWAVGEYGFIYHTSDGGKMWEHQAGGFQLSEATMNIEAGNLLFDVIAVDALTAWVVGIEGYVAKTQDGGRTWVEVASGAISRKHLFAIYAEKGSSLFIGGDALLLKCADDGKGIEKTEVEPAISYSWFYRIRPRGDAGFVAVGGEGLIYLGDNTGSIWKRVTY